MPLRRPFRKPKAPKKHPTYFSDQVIEKYSVAHYPCELYFPEPSLTFDEFGAVKDVCLSGDLELVWSKYCVVHLCKIPDVPNDTPFTLADTGQENEVCFSVVLNRNKGGDYSYVIRDEHWHEYSHKVGTAWRRFVLQFNVLEQQQFDNFKQMISSILQEVNANKIEEVDTNITYLLIAVQSDNEKRKSNLSENRNSRRSLYDLKEIESKENDIYFDSDSALSDDENPSVGEDEKGEISLAPPFDPAPYEIFAQEAQAKVETKEDNPTEHIVTKSINLLCDSLHIHPNELPQTLESLLKSTTLSETIRSREATPKLESRKSAKKDTELSDSDGEALKPNDDSERLNSEHLASEDLYVPMRLVTRPADETETTEESESLKGEMSSLAGPNPALKKAEEIAHGLEAAINNSDLVKAQEYAKELTLQNVTCRVTDLKLKEQSPSDKENEFSLKVNIEDKESSGSSIMLKVRSTDTIRDLKNRMLIKHMFPVEVQYWIIGKRIPLDTETLEKCRIKTHGYTAFLYLVSAKSAGINKEEFMKKQALLKNPDYIAGEMATMPSPGGGHTLGSSKGSATPGIKSGPSPGAKLKKEPGISRENFNVMKTEKRTPEKLQGQDPSIGGYPQGQALQQTGQEIANTLGNIAAGFRDANPMNTFSDTPLGQSRQRVAVMHPQEDEEVPQGWTCPSCTYFNQPTRPGCEICATDRPDTYEIPADYVISEEEKKRLEREELIDRQTREVPNRIQDRQYDSESERDLDKLLQFHEALQQTIRQMPTRSPPRNIPHQHDVSPRSRRPPVEISSDDELLT